MNEIGATLASVEAQIEQIDALAPDSRAEPLSVDELRVVIEALDTLREGISELSSQKRVLEGRIGGLMPEYEVIVPGLGVVSRRSSYREDWDHDAAASKIAAEANKRRYDEATGVETATAGDMLDWVLKNCVAKGRFKITGMKELGVDADKYRKRERTGTYIQITRA